MLSLRNLSDLITQVGFVAGLNCREAAYLNLWLVWDRWGTRPHNQAGSHQIPHKQANLWLLATPALTAGIGVYKAYL
jgi:hypothetical protein